MDSNTLPSRVLLPRDVKGISDEDLLTTTRRLVGASNQLLASLLVHLGEVEARGLHRTRACSSLYTYCIYELRFSEDGAFRRVSAARLVKKFPALFDAIASGELHLTAILLLGPHLTAENLVDVLARAKHRTKREITQLVRQLDPLPDVPARIEPLGPAPTRGLVTTSNPTWAKFVRAFNPVRNLDPGERPRDWMDESLQVSTINGSAEKISHQTENLLGDVCLSESNGAEPAPARVQSESAPAQRYSVQFTATTEHIDLIERAKALLSNSPEGASLAEVHLRALREFVASLEKRKYGSAEPRRKRPAAAAAPRQRGRYIPAAIRREVFERDTARCTYVGASGQRCRETQCLELHHLLPFAREGQHSTPNLTLRCRAHNALAAEQDFGREHIEQKRCSARHESFSREGATAPDTESTQRNRP